MDPVVCLLEAEFQVFYHRDFAAAAEMLSFYRDWRNKGGFQPQAIVGEFLKTARGDKFAARLQRLIVLLNERKD